MSGTGPDFLSYYRGRDLLISRGSQVAWVAQTAMESIDFYGSTDPTSPSVGRIWRDQHRICWVERDPLSGESLGAKTVLRHKVPYRVMDSARDIMLLRRLNGLDGASVIVNNVIDTAEQVHQPGNDDTEANVPEPEPEPNLVIQRLMVSISITMPDDNLRDALLTAYELMKRAHELNPSYPYMSASFNLVDAEED